MKYLSLTIQNTKKRVCFFMHNIVAVVEQNNGCHVFTTTATTGDSCGFLVNENFDKIMSSIPAEE